MRVSAAASAQSSSSADRSPSGLVPSVRRVRGSSCRAMAFTGDATLSRTNRRRPGPIARCCSSGVANTRRSTAPPVSTNAGKPRTVRPCTARSMTRGSSSRSSGQSRNPVRSSSPATACATARRAGVVSRSCSSCRSLPRATSAPSGDSTANVTRRCGGSLSRSNASTGTKTPVRRRNSRCNADSSGSAAGSIAASTARAVSGAGTKLRRRSFGSERMSAVTSSSRSAGTCQANSSPPGAPARRSGHAP